MIDFNNPALHTELPHTRSRNTTKEDVRNALLLQLDSVLSILFPSGKKQRGRFTIGDVHGNAGDSLEVAVTGKKAGLWTDHASGEGGDIFDLIAAHQGIDSKQEFSRVLSFGAGLVGQCSSLPVNKKAKREPATDELGPVTAKWDYCDVTGKLIAVVYRYDVEGKKQFRPWDAKRRKMAPPDPRPLYNQPGIAQTDQVILVEGEKCAQALIDLGMCATTAMFGANAPVDKTDWSPLIGKTVLIWPDKDKPGWDYADRASQAILAAGASSCAILYPPADRPEGWDAADAIVNGFDVYGFLQMGDRVPVTQQIVEDSYIDLGDDVDWNTEEGLAAAFTRHYGEDWRYCALWGKWFVWNNVRWNVDQSLYIHHLSRNICRTAAYKADTPRLRARLGSSSTIAAVERIIRSDPRHAATTTDWDTNVWLLNTPGGVINLRTGALRMHNRQDKITKVTTATPRGQCPNWQAFLREVMGGDTELEAYLQRVVGYCLTGVTSAHALFFLYGTGANGKSVFVNTIATILGDYAANTPMDTLMETRSDRHPTDLAGLQGARFVCAAETEQGRRWNESKVKAITGSDKITARFMRQDFFDYTPHFKLVIAGNHKPSIRNVDEALKRRLHMIPFTVTIPPEQRDGKLTEKLLAERDGILSWAIQGCLEWQRIGLAQPQRVLHATDEYFETEDTVGRWLEERCVRSRNAKSLTSELFNDWKLWAEANGEFIGSMRRFSDALLTRQLEKWRNSVGLRGFSGIGLRELSTAHQPSYPYIND